MANQKRQFSNEAVFVLMNAMLENRYSMKEIAKKIGISRQRLYQIIKAVRETKKPKA